MRNIKYSALWSLRSAKLEFILLEVCVLQWKMLPARGLGANYWHPLQYILRKCEKMWENVCTHKYRLYALYELYIRLLFGVPRYVRAGYPVQIWGEKDNFFIRQKVIFFSLSFRLAHVEEWPRILKLLKGWSNIILPVISQNLWDMAYWHIDMLIFWIFLTFVDKMNSAKLWDLRWSATILYSLLDLNHFGCRSEAFCNGFVGLMLYRRP